MAFQQGLSGLRVSSKAIDVTSHNIANAGTVGYKSSRGNFADMYANAVGSKVNVGYGAKTIAVQQQFSQGGLTATSNALDLAINGSGFFVMEAPNGSTTYTRNGEFHLNNEGYVVNDSGFFLTGYKATPDGKTIQEGVTDRIKVTNENIDPNATSRIDMGMNLNANERQPEDPTWVAEPAVDPDKTSWNPDPKTYNKTTSLSVYDSLGNPHTLSLYFVRTADPGQWNVYANLDSTATTFIDGQTTDQPILTLQFDENGKLTEDSLADMPTEIKILQASLKTINEINGFPDSGAADMVMSFDLSNSTQFAGDFAVTDLFQDGYTTGYTTGISVSDDGIVQQNYSNGEIKNIGQVILASFTNEQGLLSIGDNQWRETRDSGPAKVGIANTSNLGGIIGQQIEESNVDLTNELVNLIIFQRNYQANAKSITTQDTLMQTVINMN